MQDAPEGQTRSCATLDDEVLAQLDVEAGWLTSHALLQRCDFARDSDQLGECLSRLHRKGKLQRVHGDVGLLYGPLGIDPPSRTVTTGAPKLPTLHDLNRQAATAHVVKVAAMESGVVANAPVEETLVLCGALQEAPTPTPAPLSAAAAGSRLKSEHARETILALIRRCGRVRTGQVREALGVGPQATKYHLQQLQKAGDILRIGTTSSSYYELATPAPAPAETIAPAEPSAESEAPTKAGPKPTAFVFDDASLESAQGGKPITLRNPATGEERTALLPPMPTSARVEAETAQAAAVKLKPLRGSERLVNWEPTVPEARELLRGIVKSVAQHDPEAVLLRSLLHVVPIEQLVPGNTEPDGRTNAFEIQQGDFALWSDGTLQIRSDDVDVILAKPAQAALRNYLLGMGDLP